MLKDTDKEKLFRSVQAARMDEVREILTGLKRSELQYLQSLMRDPDAFPDEIRRVLPLSVRKMVDSGEITVESLLPVIEEAMRESIRKDPEKLADILFPVMMPAIRKAVAADIRQMLESLNNTLENSFSPKKLGWRLQALFSGRKYSEIVLSHAYIYQVKQVFLIHKATGLLLAQAADNTHDKAADADMVSSMLSAIKDFVQDSFSGNKDSTLEEINVGRMRILIEQGPYAILAAVVEGNVPKAYHDLMKETIEGIHVSFFKELENFSGDVSVFEKDKTLLERCLQKEQKPEKKRKPVFAVFLLLLLIAGIAYGAYLGINRHRHYKNLLTRLQHTPGIVITQSHNPLFGKMVFEGLRDPLSEKPSVMVAKSNIRPNTVRFLLKPYLSVEPSLVLQRASALLKPPATVRMGFKDGVLYVSGTADSAWLHLLLQKYPMVFGVEKLEMSLQPEKKIKIKKVRRNILAIEKHVFHFKYNVFTLNQNQAREFDSLINEVKNVLNFSMKQDSVPVIIVNSFTSYAGNVKGNRYVAAHRARQFIDRMIRHGIPPEVLIPKVRFIEDFHNKYENRSVSFQVKYVKPKNL